MMNVSSWESVGRTAASRRFLLVFIYNHVCAFIKHYNKMLYFI